MQCCVAWSNSSPPFIKWLAVARARNQIGTIVLAKEVAQTVINCELIGAPWSPSQRDSVKRMRACIITEAMTEYRDRRRITDAVHIAGHSNIKCHPAEVGDIRYA